MELRREGRKDIWLRLDRRRENDISTLGFFAASMSSVSNDMVGAAANYFVGYIGLTNQARSGPTFVSEG